MVEALAQAREQFLALVADLRPELHRYCARLMGSIIDGEDVVQDALAKAFYAMSMQSDLPPLRPWLFRIAHNAAIDRLRSHGHKLTETRAELDDVMPVDDRPDPIAVRAALSRFLALTVTQRAAVILKDVLGHSLEETASTMDTTVPAVKAALVRGRAALRAGEPEPITADAARRAQLATYARLFNARDWDGVRALIGEDCRLDLVSKSQRRGKAVGMYFGNYEKLDIRLELARVDGRDVLAAFVDGAAAPAYWILLEWDGDRVQLIRDFRYVPYIAAEAALASDQEPQR
ncbi:MAG: RNA polymerase sigma factor [Myxococcales bacterium]|nr:RNA polymerase sigma factor [Myxococcales bacterium]